MLTTPQREVRELVDALTSKYGAKRNALMQILQEIQTKNGFVSNLAMQEIANRMGIHPVEVYGFISFYGFLRSEATGKFVIRLCGTVSCNMANKDAVARQLENDLGIKFGETTPDGYFSLERASCLGMCDRGPAMLVNDRVYTEVAADQVARILADCRKRFGPSALREEEE